MVKALAPGREALPHSGIREVVNEALRLPGCIRLEVGEPNFATPEHIVRAAYDAVLHGATTYTATAGLLSLREAICTKLCKVNGIEATPDQINVAAGGVCGIAAALTALLAEGDEALIPDPGWPNYTMQVQCAGATPVSYPLRAADGFEPDPREVERLITPRTKVLVLNSPGNPTGAVFSEETMRALVDVALRHDLYILSDECYDQLVFEGRHVSPASLYPDPRIISCFTFSKTYAMTGWRVGYVVAGGAYPGAPAPILADTITKILEATISCAATPSQAAALAALQGPQECVQVMRTAYDERRKRVCRFLSDHGLLDYTPRGAFYVMVNIAAAGSPQGRDARAFAFALLREQGVAVAPGTAFGREATRHVRVSLASSDADLDEGLARLSRYIEQRSSSPTSIAAAGT